MSANPLDSSHRKVESKSPLLEQWHMGGTPCASMVYLVLAGHAPLGPKCRLAARTLPWRPCGEGGKPQVAPNGLAVCIFPNTQMAPGPEREPWPHPASRQLQERGPQQMNLLSLWRFVTKAETAGTIHRPHRLWGPGQASHSYYSAEMEMGARNGFLSAFK